jgi:hypothetical protein
MKTKDTCYSPTLTPVRYKFYISDANRVDEVINHVRFDVNESSLIHYQSNAQNFTVINYELNPDSGDEFIYGWEWLNEHFTDCLKLVTVDY